MSMPLLTVGVVAAQDPDGGGVTVLLRTSLQAPGYPVKMMYYGPADQLRIKQTPLPSRGTWGLVAFPYGDNRNGIWLGSFLPAGIDAITATTAGAAGATDAFIDYEAQFSGFWKLIDGLGNMAMQWPDGTSFVLGATSGVPTTYYHVVDPTQARIKEPIAQSTRVPDPPSAYNLSFQMTSGLSVTVDPSGNMTVTSASGTITLSTQNDTLQITPGGSYLLGTTGSLAVSGNLSAGNGVTGMFTTPTGQTVTVQDGIVTNIF